MAFLDETYFHGDIYIPHLISQSSGIGQQAQNSKSNTVDFIFDFIVKYESEFLNKLLGEELHKNFIIGYKESPRNEIWDNLYNAIYWEEDGYKYSPSANYVYFFITKRMQTTSTGKGEARLNNSTSDNVSPYQIMMDAWNNMSCQVERFYCNFLYKNWDIYKEYGEKPCYHFGFINNFGI